MRLVRRLPPLLAGRVAVATLVTGAADRASAQNVLVREAARLLPPSASILDGRYGDRCHAILARRSPACESGRRCRAPLLARYVDSLICEDLLVLELGPPAVWPKIELPPASVLDHAYQGRTLGELRPLTTPGG